jgi:hypothetical protein
MINVNKRLEELRKVVSENKKAAGETARTPPLQKQSLTKGAQMYPGRLCPFMSRPEKQVICNSHCKLFKDGIPRQRYSCPLQELPPISFASFILGKKSKV